MDNNINNQNNVKNDINAKLKSYWNNPIIVTIIGLFQYDFNFVFI